MRIVYVSREFGPVTGGGIGTYIYNVCRAMVGRGHEVSLVTDCFDSTNQHFLPPGVELIETLPSLALHQKSFSNLHHEYSYRVLDTLRQLRQKIKIDVIEFAEYGAEGFACIRAKRVLNEFAEIKLIVKLHTPSSLLCDINEDKLPNVGAIYRCAMEDYCVEHADMVTSPSKSLANYFKNRIGRIDIQLCPYPMDLPELRKPRQFNAAMTKCVRLIGSVQVRKGVDIFIEAAKIVLADQPDFSFEIYGVDSTMPILEQSYTSILQRNIPTEYSDRIRFCGAVDYHKIPNLLLESCFCVFPSRWENWANVCLEAMSMGCVVIASKRGGMSEMITNGQDGFLIDPLKPEEIANVIIEHHEDQFLLQTISQMAHRRSKQICDPEMTSRIIEGNYLKSLDKKQWRPAHQEDITVSVVIPYFNQPEYLNEAVASVKQSTYEHIEIVVVNDGSSTPEAELVFNQLQGVIKINKTNGGLSSARNAGIAAASGDLILPLDSDDKIHPDYIRLAVEALINHPELAYISCHAHNFGASDQIRIRAYIPIGYVPELMLFINTDGKCANLFHKSVFEQCGGYDENMPSYEDWDFLITLHENGFKGDVLPDELFYYRRHFDSMVNTTANRLRTELIQYMLAKHTEAWKPYAATMAAVLAWFWKEAEKRDEFAHLQINNLALRPENLADLQIGNSTRLEIYLRLGGDYWELRFIYVDYPCSEWTTLTINIPFGLKKKQWRFDPSNRPGTILIKEIVLIAQKSEHEIWRADAANHFSGCEVLCNDEHYIFNDCLLIKAATNDPQIMLPEFVFENQSAALRVTLRFEENFQEENYAPPPNYSQQSIFRHVRRKLSKLLSVFKWYLNVK